jgi:hypothetical protein
MPDLGATVLEAWTALGLHTGVTRSAHVYAATSATHVLGIALLVGPILLADLRLLGGLRTLDAAALAVLRRTARIGVALALTSGVLLASARPAEYLDNRVFLAKLLVITVGLVNAAAFELRLRRGGRMFDRPATKLAAGISLVAWLVCLALGRWIAFV